MTPAYYAVPWSSMEWRGQSIGLLFLLAYAVYLPGHSLNRAFGRRSNDPLADAAASSLYGLAFMLAVMFVWSLTGVSLEVLTLLMPAFVAAATVASLMRSGTAPEGEAPASAGIVPPLVFTALLVALSFVVLRAGVPINFTADTIDHVGYVAEIQETGRPFPTTAFYIEGGENGKDIRKGFLHSFYGYASAYAGMEPLRFLNVINTALAVLMLLAVYAVALYWFRDAWVGVLAAVVFAFGAYGGLSTLLIRVAYFPSRFAVVLFLFLLVAALDYLWHNRRDEWPRIAIFAFAACATHVFFAILIGFFGAVMLVWKNCFALNDRATHYRRVVTIGLWIAVGALPVCIFRYLTDYPRANELHTEVQGVLLLGPVFIAEPAMLFRWLGPLGLAAILCAIPLWARKGTHPALGYMIAAAMTVVLVLLNPLLLPLLHKVMTYLTFRIALLFPFYILAAYYLIGYLREGFGRRDGYERIVTLGPLHRTVAFLLAAGLVLQVVPGARTVASWPGARAAEASQSHRLWSDGLDFLAGVDHAVVVSDPLTAYTVPAFTTNYVVCALDQHVPPNDQRLPERILTARDIISPIVSMRRTVEQLQRTGAEYIVLNNHFRGGLLLHYWEMSDAVFADCVNKFDTFPDLFDRVYETSDFIVYRYRGGSTNEATAPNPWRLDALPPDYRVVGTNSGVARLEAARVHAGTLRSGDSFDLSSVWSVDHALPLDNYMITARFDHVAVPLPFDGKPFPKLSRKFVEKTSGELYRFRSDHKVAGGILSPDTWEVGDLIHDRTTITLPSNLSRGEYTVQLKLLRVPHTPIFTVHDFLYDDDLFAGVEVGRITVE